MIARNSSTQVNSLSKNVIVAGAGCWASTPNRVSRVWMPTSASVAVGARGRPEVETAPFRDTPLIGW
jgi:hypothetical protein